MRAIAIICGLIFLAAAGAVHAAGESAAPFPPDPPAIQRIAPCPPGVTELSDWWAAMINAQMLSLSGALPYGPLWLKLYRVPDSPVVVAFAVAETFPVGVVAVFLDGCKVALNEHLPAAHMLEYFDADSFENLP